MADESEGATLVAYRFRELRYTFSEYIRHPNSLFFGLLLKLFVLLLREPDFNGFVSCHCHPFEGTIPVCHR
jgi:hypothetical protein